MQQNAISRETRRARWRLGRWGLALALAAAVALLVAWRAWSPPTVTVAHPTRGPAVEGVYATGSVEAGVTTRIAPQVGGRLVALLVDEGAEVEAGQVLARLDDSDLRASLGDEQARLRYAEEHLRRLEALFRAGYATIDQIDQARTSRDSARATTQRLIEQIRFMTLRAADAGRVIRRDGEVGDFIPVNQPVFYLARKDGRLRITSDVDEEDIASVRVGQPVLVTADAFPGRVFEGRVTDITPKGDPLSRGYRVRVALPADAPLMIGMTAETNIILSRRERALLVPISAVNGNSVWVVRGSRALALTVKLGAKGAERAEIRQGLSDGDLVIVQPPADLKPGQRVRAETVTATSASAAK